MSIAVLQIARRIERDDRITAIHWTDRSASADRRQREIMSNNTKLEVPINKHYRVVTIVQASYLN